MNNQLPSWVSLHLYSGKKFDNLTAMERQNLKNRLSHFKDAHPLVSVIIPAWNEEENIFCTLSSLAANQCKYPVEIVVINNNSTDSTQDILDELGVRSYFQSKQGIAYARQMGLMVAKGVYHLCADSDTLYPPKWIELMVKPMKKNSLITGVYGRYSFIPQPYESRLPYYFYEKITGILIRFRKINREYLNVFGFNMGFITEVGRATGGFESKRIRKFDNPRGTQYVDESEDGRMAINLKKKGKLKLVSDHRARVFTSSRRFKAEGGLVTSFKNRVKLQLKRMKRLNIGKKVIPN